MSYITRSYTFILYVGSKYKLNNNEGNKKYSLMNITNSKFDANQVLNLKGGS